MDSGIVVAKNRIHDLRDTSMGITTVGFEISGIRLFNVEDVSVWRNMIRDLDNVLNPSTFTSRARGIFISGGPLGSYRSKPEGVFNIQNNVVENIRGFRAIGINVTRMDQDVAFGDLVLAGNKVSNIFDSGLILGSIGFEICEVEELVGDVDMAKNSVRMVNTAFALRNSVDLLATRNTVKSLNPIGSTLNLVLDAIDFPGTGHDNIFCRNTLDAAGGILVGPEVFDNTFPFGRTFTFPFGLPDSPGLGGDGTVEAANIRCESRDFVCSFDHGGGRHGRGHDRDDDHDEDHDDD